MEENKSNDKIALLLEFTTILDKPFDLSIEINQIYLDPKLFKIEILNNLKSILITTQKDNQSYDLEVKSVFELDINIRSTRYQKIINESKPGPPILDDLFHKLEDSHKTLVYGIINYIAWRKGVNAYAPYTKVKINQVHWLFNGLSSYESPKLQFEFGEHYMSIQNEALEIVKDDFKYFYDIYNAGTPVPIHQELLAELNNLISTHSNRTSYLMLYVTLEVATKTLVKTKKPDTDYLISKVQSPDLFNLYTQYINLEIAQLVDDNEAKTLKKMAGIRNGIAHRGEAVSLNILSSHYEFVKSLIKRIEYVMGYI